MLASSSKLTPEKTGADRSADQGGLVFAQWFNSEIKFNITRDRKNYNLATVSTDTHQSRSRHGKPDQRPWRDESYRKIFNHSNSIVDSAFCAAGGIFFNGLDTAARPATHWFLSSPP